MLNRHALSIKVFICLLSIVFLFSAFSDVPAQKKRTKQTKKPAQTQPTTQPSVIDDIYNAANTILNGTQDPYAQFRDVTYSNEGLLSEKDEVTLGDELHKEVIKRFKLIPEGQARVNRIGQQVVRYSLRPNLKYYFSVYESKEINAFAIPGGRIYMASALVANSTDDELASVLAHEVGHIVARHSLHAIQNAKTVGGFAELLGSITGIAGQDAQQLGKLAAELIASPFLLAHNREQEREADYLGINAMKKAGYNPQGMVLMFEKLKKVSQTEPSLLGSLFSSHPDVDERIENSRYEINRLNQKNKTK